MLGIMFRVTDYETAQMGHWLHDNFHTSYAFALPLAALLVQAGFKPGDAYCLLRALAGPAPSSVTSQIFVGVDELLVELLQVSTTNTSSVPLPYAYYNLF